MQQEWVDKGQAIANEPVPMTAMLNILSRLENVPRNVEAKNAKGLLRGTLFRTMSGWTTQFVKN
jgi:hypothetical protein